MAISAASAPAIAYFALVLMTSFKAAWRRRVHLRPSEAVLAASGEGYAHGRPRGSSWVSAWGCGAVNYFAKRDHLMPAHHFTPASATSLAGSGMWTAPREKSARPSCFSLRVMRLKWTPERP